MSTEFFLFYLYWNGFDFLLILRLRFNRQSFLGTRRELLGWKRRRDFFRFNRHIVLDFMTSSVLLLFPFHASFRSSSNLIRKIELVIFLIFRRRWRWRRHLVLIGDHLILLGGEGFVFRDGGGLLRVV